MELRIPGIVQRSMYLVADVAKDWCNAMWVDPSKSRHEIIKQRDSEQIAVKLGQIAVHETQQTQN